MTYWVPQLVGGQRISWRPWPGRRLSKALRHARVTANRHEAGIAVRVHAKGMTAPGSAAASDPQAPSRTLSKHEAKRWSIEPSFKETKDLRSRQGNAFYSHKQSATP